jgi:hypothetical protein
VSWTVTSQTKADCAAERGAGFRSAKTATIRQTGYPAKTMFTFIRIAKAG